MNIPIEIKTLPADFFIFTRNIKTLFLTTKKAGIKGDWSPLKTSNIKILFLPTEKEEIKGDQYPLKIPFIGKDSVKVHQTLNFPIKKGDN